MCQTIRCRVLINTIYLPTKSAISWRTLHFFYSYQKEVIKFTINGQRYNMWVNSYKDKNSQPDYKIYEDNYVAPTETKPQSKPDFKPLSEDDLF